ncbi:DUF2634 domain-containing protein [Clostridium frigidicarnis]|uniref:DUF2634 domain-containing protein n=1 Tax=Clostridium frigidicarnis TaxID=84698 RepID=A0A1I0V150_9CLOT|nr:DUF2634 domain-containing protein [Clostridium frigidicarnis]SFA70045.1 Protein of unknown function [Clostridium frigidicarnis]
MGLFPTGAPLQTPINTQQDIEVKKVGRSFMFDFKTGQFLMKDGQIKDTTKIQALEQWIELCLRTHKDKFNIYKDSGFGCNTEDMINKKLNAFYKTEMRREIEEAILKNEQFTKINSLTLEQKGFNLIVHLEIELKNKSLLEREVKISV